MHTIARINVGNVHFCEPQICWSLCLCCNYMFLHVQISILTTCHNAVLKVWLGLGAKVIGLGKDHVWAYLGLTPLTKLQIYAFAVINMAAKIFLIFSWNGLKLSLGWHLAAVSSRSHATASPSSPDNELTHIHVIRHNMKPLVETLIRYVWIVQT